MYTYTYIHIHIYIYVFAQIYLHIYTYMYEFIFTSALPCRTARATMDTPDPMGGRVNLVQSDFIKTSRALQHASSVQLGVCLGRCRGLVGGGQYFVFLYEVVNGCVLGCLYLEMCKHARTHTNTHTHAGGGQKVVGGRSKGNMGAGG